MKNLLLILILFIPEFAFSQSIKEYVLTHTQEIESIDPDDADYSDLAPLKTAIGDARVVMLGEQTHGDGTAFRAKSRIIKMLHEEMDFDVLVFESDFYGMQYVNMHKDSLGFETLKSNLYGIWSECPQLQSLFDYCKNNDSLILTGCDSRHSGLYTKNNYVKDFDRFMESTRVAFYTSGYADFKPVLEEIIRNEYKSQATADDKLLFFSGIDSIAVQLARLESDDKEFWLQELKNLRMFAEFSWKNPPESKTTTDERDRQMGDNLIWLATKMYPGKKIILWAHNMHILKNPKAGFKHTTASHFLMQTDITHYVIGFDSYTGNFAFAGSMSRFDEKIKSAKKESMETWLNKSGYSYAFLNFNNYEGNSAPFYMRGNGNIYNKLQWDKNYDGVFYIREMNGCEE